VNLLSKLCLLPLLFLSCSDHALIEKGIGPRALIYPEFIDFGHYDIMQDASVLATETFVIVNTGDEELEIEDVLLTSIEGNENAFSIGDFSDLSPIQPGDSYEFTVEFTPENYEIDVGIIEIWTDASPQSGDAISGDYLVVNVNGYGDAPDIEVEPRVLDFGEVIINCHEESEILVRNNGNVDLIISGIEDIISTTFPGNFTVNFGTLPPFPWVIPPGQTYSFTVEYDALPELVNADSMLDIRILSNDIDEPEVWIDTDVYNGSQQAFTETWLAEETPMVDIVFVIDNSGSMARFQQMLSSEATGFITAFEALGVDYRVGIITTDNGWDITWFSKNDPDPTLLMQQNIMVGTWGSANERGLHSIYDCMYIGECGPHATEFRRQNAQLAFIILSDEEDWSPNDWTWYKSMYEAAVDPGLLSFHGIIGDQPGGCSTTGYGVSAMAGDGYHDLISFYGGFEYSICSSSWASPVQTLASNIAVPLRYTLDKSDVDTSTIVVLINGQTLDASEWTWLSDSNSVLISASSAPEAGDTITISYEVGTCH
jgi:hypothetical protein